MTTAHAGFIEEATRLLPPRETLLLLATANVDKAVSGLPLETRLELLLRYANPRPDVSIGVIAHGRFADKVEAIRAAYPDATRVVFLLGFDTLIRLFDPKYYDDPETSLARLFRWSECVVGNRGPDDPSALGAFLIRPDVAPFAHRIHLIRLPGHLAAVSATDVRARLVKGEPIAGLVPSEITAPLETWWHRTRQEFGL
jgi:nicotinic acid mononucleotide adenylyltransferase